MLTAAEIALPLLPRGLFITWEALLVSHSVLEACSPLWCPLGYYKLRLPPIINCFLFLAVWTHLGVACSKTSVLKQTRITLWCDTLIWNKLEFRTATVSQVCTYSNVIIFSWGMGRAYCKRINLTRNHGFLLHVMGTSSDEKQAIYLHEGASRLL